MIEVLLQAQDENGELLEAAVKLLALPSKDDTIEIDAPSGTHVLYVIDTPHHTPAIGMHDPQVMVPVDLRHDRMGMLKEAMKAADKLRTQDGPR